MKPLHMSLTVLGGILVMYALVRRSEAQWFQDPSKTFQNITFDMANRGSYNVSDCLGDMMMCWEAVKTDMICFWWRWYATICGIRRDRCVERYGDRDNYLEHFNMVEGLCWSRYWFKYT